MVELDEERDRVDRALAEAGVGWDAWPTCAATAPMDPRARLSALLLLLAMPVHRTAHPDDGTHVSGSSAATLDRVRRRRLPWDAATAGLALALVAAEPEAFDATRVRIALRGAEAVGRDGAADLALMEELTRCQQWLDGIPDERWQLPTMRRLVRQVLASIAPPDLLDLSLIRPGDGWGAPARDLARLSASADTAALVRRLGELGDRRPSGAWLEAVEAALRSTDARQLLRSWLDLAARSPVIEVDESVHGTGHLLFADGNDDLVRAAVLATRGMPTETWVPALLGDLVLRGETVALKVASAALATLEARGSADDRSVLEDLLGRVTRRDFVQRIGRALGRQDDADARSAALRRSKAAAVRRKADPAPRQARAAVDVLIRRHLGPELRRLGFAGSGRTWRRVHPDRVDVVALTSADEELWLSYGTRFDAVHPPDEPYPVARLKVRHSELDIQVTEECVPSASGLAACARRLSAAVLPFLDQLGHYDLARAYLEHGAGAPTGVARVDRPGSPSAWGILGMLALSVGDRDTAIDDLRRRLAFEESRGHDDDALASARFWRAQLRRARRLPGARA